MSARMTTEFAWSSAVHDEDATGVDHPVQLGDAQGRHFLAYEIGGGVFFEGQLGLLVHGATKIDHVVEHIVNGAWTERFSHGAAASAAEEIAGDVGDLDLVGAGVDLEYLGIPGQLLNSEFGHVTVPTEELHRFHGHFGCGLG